MRPSILTARWNASWPDTMDIRYLSVHRILPAPHSNWNESYWQKNLVQWIGLHAKEYDAIYVDRADALLPILSNKGSSWNLPLICRFAPGESSLGLAPAARLANQAASEACKKCQSIVVNNASDHRYLISQGVADAIIQRVEEPPSAWIQRTTAGRGVSRRSLANLSADFVVPDRTAVIAHLGATDWASLRQALDSICDLLDSGGMLRVWIVNPFISYSVIHEYLKDRGWHREVLIFDGFDDLEELAKAADLLWVTNPSESAQFTLPLFLAASVPVIVRESEALPSFLSELTKGRTYGSPTDLALLLHSWYANQEAALDHANKIRSQLAAHYGSVDIAKVWMEMMGRICDKRKA
ncbi:MAG: hypothetical protein MUC43_02215 [Pirellula sp.]|nr:hypothetical protein [Pirellula sp.]